MPKELYAGEKRVATTPEVSEQLHKLGFSVAMEAGAGKLANYSDEAYREAGVEIMTDRAQLWADSDIILKVRAPAAYLDQNIDETALIQNKHTLISFIWPAQNKELMDKLASTGATVLAVDSVPRISRAQKMDGLSSMANIAGYRAVVEAAQHFGRFFTGQITAAENSTCKSTHYWCRCCRPISHRCCKKYGRYSACV